MKNTYKKNPIKRSTLGRTEVTEGQTIERQISAYLKGETELTEKTEMVYTERKNGVLAGTNVRTDKFDIAIEMNDKAAKSHQTKRLDRLTVVKNDEEVSGAESTQGTNE